MAKKQYYKTQIDKLKNRLKAKPKAKKKPSFKINIREPKHSKVYQKTHKKLETDRYGILKADIDIRGISIFDILSVIKYVLART